MNSKYGEERPGELNLACMLALVIQLDRAKFTQEGMASLIAAWALLHARQFRHGRARRARRASRTGDALRPCDPHTRPTAWRTPRHHSNDLDRVILHALARPLASPAPTRATSCSPAATRPRPWRTH